MITHIIVYLFCLGHEGGVTAEETWDSSHVTASSPCTAEATDGSKDRKSKFMNTEEVNL